MKYILQHKRLLTAQIDAIHRMRLVEKSHKTQPSSIVFPKQAICPIKNTHVGYPLELPNADWAPKYTVCLKIKKHNNVIG